MKNLRLKKEPPVETQYSVECTVFKEYGDNVFCIDVLKTKLYDNVATPDHIDGYVSNLPWGTESDAATDAVFADKSPSVGPKSIYANYYDTLEEAKIALKEIKEGAGEPKDAYQVL